MRMVNPIQMMIDKKKMRYNIKLSSSLDIITQMRRTMMVMMLKKNNIKLIKNGFQPSFIQKNESRLTIILDEIKYKIINIFL